MLVQYHRLPSVGKLSANVNSTCTNPKGKVESVYITAGILPLLPLNHISLQGRYSRRSYLHHFYLYHQYSCPAIRATCSLCWYSIDTGINTHVPTVSIAE